MRWIKHKNSCSVCRPIQHETQRTKGPKFVNKFDWNDSNLLTCSPTIRHRYEETPGLSILDRFLHPFCQVRRSRTSIPQPGSQFQNEIFLQPRTTPFLEHCAVADKQYSSGCTASAGGVTQVELTRISHQTQGNRFTPHSPCHVLVVGL